jgi:hypothetical protein
MKRSDILHTCLLFAGAILLFSCRQETVLIKADGTVDDYTPVVRKILEEHPEGNISIHFAPGRYEFFPEKAKTEYLSMSNNDSGDRKVAFLIKDMKNVSVSCDSAEFLFHGAIVPFAVKNSEDVRLEGFSIDYDYPWTFEGEVIASDPREKSFVVRVFPDNRYRIENGRLFFGGYDWEYPLAENIVFDPKTRRPYYNTAIYEHGYWAGEMKAEEIEPGIVRFSGLVSRDVPPTGSIWDDKGPIEINRSHPGFAILQSSNVEISDVHVFKAGSMALIAEFSENIRVSGMSTAARPGSPRMITISADATHFVDCRGTVILEDCTFESMLDDATNVHGVYMKVDTIVSPKVFRTSFGHFQQEGNHFADEGDILRFVNRKTLRPVAEAPLLRISRTEKNCYELETGFDLSTVEDISELAVENISRGCSVIIRNCSVRYNRARSLLLSTSGDVLVENCDFSSMMAGIRICGDANYWYESGNTRNIIIRANRFTDGGLGGGQPQAILQIDPVIPKEARGNDFFYHGNIVFSGNTVETFDSQIIYGLSVKNLEITGNVFIDSKSHEPIFPGLSVIDVQYCGNVTIEGNDFSRWKPDATISVHNCMEVTNGSTLPVVDNPNPFFYGS